jgi:hypothetical protein
MAAVFSYGLLRNVQSYIQGSAPTNPDLRLGLFKDSAVIGPNQDHTDFTEPSNSGYGTIAISSTGWSEVSATPDVVLDEHDSVTFTFDAGTAEVVKGYFVYDSFTASFWWADFLPGGDFTIPSAGGTLTLTLRLKDLQCSS